MKTNIALITLLISLCLLSNITSKKFINELNKLSDTNTNTINIPNKEIFTAQKLQELNYMSSPIVDPSGKYIVYTLSKATIDTTEQTDSKKISIIQREIATSKETTLTEAAGTVDTTPHFSAAYPNTLFILSSRDGGVSKVHTVDFPFTAETVPVKLFDTPISISGYKISSSGTGLAFAANVFHECRNDVLNCSKTEFDKIAARGPNTWAVYDELMMNHWDIWGDGSVSHVLYQKLTPVEGKPTVVETDLVIDLLNGVNGNSPVPPFGGDEMYAISPDGTEVTLTVHLRGAEEAIRTNWRTWSIVAQETPEPVDLSDGMVGRTQNPKYSSDGNTIYFLVMPRPDLESDYLFLHSYNKTDKTHTDITKFLDYSVQDYVFSLDNTMVIFGIDYDGSSELRSLPLADAKIENLKVLTGDMTSMSVPFYQVAGENDTVIFYAVETSDLFPSKAVSITLKSDLSEKVTEYTDLVNVNFNFETDYDIPAYKKFHFKAENSDKVQGWIMNPINFDAEKTYPLAYLIHGGPEGSWGNHWSTRWNPMLWANQGYVVVMVNPEGSTGQGQTFVDKVRNDWGGAPFRTLMTGVKHLKETEEYKFIDTTKACAVGASYGGYMVNWIQSNPDKHDFKCLVTHDGVFSTLSMFYITEELWFPRAEYCPLDKVGCMPFESEEARLGFTKFSPQEFVDNWQTPHLIIHGSRDLRIPISEGISAFTALQMKGVESKFVHFEMENHWVLRPLNSIGWYKNVVEWMDKHTKN